jgi:hypothetical protein
MCGPSGAETSLQNQSAGFSTQLMNNYAQLFGQQQSVLKGLNASVNPIVAAGPSQRGFSGAETAALNTSAINRAGAAATNALQAARTFGAGQGGGGTSGLTSGITKQIESSVASQQAGNLATTEGNIEQADWATGNQNYFKALGAEEGIAQMYNPNGAQSGAIGANQESFGEASKINQENNALGQDVAGFLTAAAGSAGDIVKGFKR